MRGSYLYLKIKPSEEMWRESLSLPHALFRKPGLESVSRSGLYFPAVMGEMLGRGKNAMDVPRHCPGSAQPRVVGVPGHPADPTLPPFTLSKCKDWEDLCLTECICVVGVQASS